MPWLPVRGPQSTGKTTLVNGLMEEFQALRGTIPTLLRNGGHPEITRSEPNALATNTGCTREVEHTALGKSLWSASDRSALDLIVYAHTYAGTDAAKKITESGTWQAIR
ncbi:unnamed protein product [Clonostachys solani]|uniref:NadR/Ttd14 AAA domain-containing protein n=1 Tax=Clonostachys solani TaxID=160281 RepID=A0A9P0EN66_9HYPO|nr:unnamed protein product [Clonostachys solani]